jgi:hypothetical protein
MPQAARPLWSAVGISSPRIIQSSWGPARIRNGLSQRINATWLRLSDQLDPERKPLCGEAFATRRAMVWINEFRFVLRLGGGTVVDSFWPQLSPFNPRRGKRGFVVWQSGTECFGFIRIFGLRQTFHLLVYCPGLIKWGSYGPSPKGLSLAPP